MKKAIVIIQSRNGQHKSSIIRTISQILIGLNEDTVVNVGELGLSENITSVVETGALKIGVATQNDVSDNTLEMIKDLDRKSCDVILCAIHFDSDGVPLIRDYAAENDFQTTTIKSNWSEKLEVNYLTEDQINRILNEIDRISSQLS